MKNINEHNKVISKMNDQIDGLLNEGLFDIATYFLPGSFFTKWALRKAWDDDDKHIDKDDKDLIDDLKDKIEVDLDGEDIENIDDDKFDEIIDDLNKLLDKQLELFNQLNKSSLGSVRISFGDPVEFKLIRGREKDKKMRLEGTKDYEVYKVEKTKRGKYKVYFKYENWMREYDIMFSFEVKSLTERKKQDNVTINVVYVDPLRKKSQSSRENIEFEDEKVLTHKAKIEIKDTQS